MMKTYMLAAVAALSASATAATNTTTHHFGTKPFGNATHYTNPHTNKTVQHFANWSNGTHFNDVATNQTIKHFDCDVNHNHTSASDHFVAFSKQLAASEKTAVGSLASRAVLKKRQGLVSPAMAPIPLYLHLITTAASASLFTPDMLTAQATTMNTVYNAYGITFQLMGTTTTVNDAWAVAAGTDMDDAKAALRQGTYGALNVYLHSDLTGGILGTCTLPSQVPAGADPSEYVSDGCNISAHTMPGADMLGYNEGMTAVHETGHWLGLLHTFEGYACSGDGDYVSDTQFESVSTNGCPTDPVKNSCPGVSTGDPIHNYMDYSTDACYTRFTAGQVSRISSMWSQYRLGM